MAPPSCGCDQVSLPAQLYSRALRLGPNRRAEWKEIFRRDCVNVLSILVCVCVRVCVRACVCVRLCVLEDDCACLLFCVLDNVSRWVWL